MVEQREGDGYRQVSLPAGLYKRIEDKVASSKGDFKSVADYVKYVIRRSLEGDEAAVDNAPRSEVTKEAA